MRILIQVMGSEFQIAQIVSGFTLSSEMLVPVDTVRALGAIEMARAVLRYRVLNDVRGGKDCSPMPIAPPPRNPARVERARRGHA